MGTNLNVIYVLVIDGVKCMVKDKKIHHLRVTQLMYEECSYVGFFSFCF